MSVTLTHKQPSVTSTKATVTIPAGSFQSALDSLRGLALGTDTIIASAPGYNPDTTIVVVGPGRIALSSWPSTLISGDSTQVRVSVRDQTNSGRSVTAATTFTLTGSNLAFANGGASTPTINITIAAGNSTSDFFWLKATGAAGAAGTATVSSANYTTLDAPSVSIGATVAATTSNTFDPASVTILEDGQVRWTFAALHNVTFSAATGAPTNISDRSSGSVTRTFSTPGTFNYHCTIHGTATSGMRGTVVVQPASAQGQVAAAAGARR